MELKIYFFVSSTQFLIPGPGRVRQGMYGIFFWYFLSLLWFYSDENLYVCCMLHCTVCTGHSMHTVQYSVKCTGYTVSYGKSACHLFVFVLLLLCFFRR